MTTIRQRLDRIEAKLNKRQGAADSGYVGIMFIDLDGNRYKPRHDWRPGDPIDYRAGLDDLVSISAGG